MQNTPQLSAEMEKRFDDWFSQFTRPYEEYEKNKEKLWEMLGVVGEKEAPMEIIARLEEIKRLRKMQYLFKKHFLATALEEQKQETLSEVEGWLDENVQPLDLVEDDLRAKLAEMKK